MYIEVLYKILWCEPLWSATIKR